MKGDEFMAKYDVYLTRQIPDKGLDILKKECNLKINPKDCAPEKEEIIENIKDVDGLISLLSDPIDADVVKSNSNLKVISNYAVGYNNIDIKVANEMGVIVTNTPGILTETTADLTWALIMATSRRIVESDKFSREGKFKGWAPKLMLGSDVYKKTLGIIGFGRIGQAVGRRALGFDMNVLYFKRNPLKEKEEKQSISTDMKM